MLESTTLAPPRCSEFAKKALERPSWTRLIDTDFSSELSKMLDTFRGETILLVEENERLRDEGRGILASLGYRVLEAANGREVLPVYEAERAAPPEADVRSGVEGPADPTESGIDLVITDVVMPQMGGKRLLQELRTGYGPRRPAPALKVLAITGYTVPEALEALREAGFHDVVGKPFDVVTLGQVVRRAIEGD